MIDTDGTLLRGLPGDNPLGFFAALGAQAALVEQGLDHKLHWTDDPIPHAVVSPTRGLEEIANAVLAASERWLSGPALSEAIDPKLKLKPPHIREYLSHARNAGASGALAWCLLAEDSLDNGGVAKPSDLYFTAGQMKFVAMARTILSDVTEAEIVDDIARPWRYHSKRGSLMWDCVDDRDHALSAADPTDKSRNPQAHQSGRRSSGDHRPQPVPVLRGSAGNSDSGLLGKLEAGLVRLAVVVCSGDSASCRVPARAGCRAGGQRAASCRLVPVLGDQQSHAVTGSPKLPGGLRNVRPAQRGSGSMNRATVLAPLIRRRLVGRGLSGPA